MADKSLWRSLGEFVGHVAKGVKTDVTQPQTKPDAGNQRRVVNEQTTEEVRDTPAGPVKLRRTVIEEIELPHSAVNDRNQTS